MFSKKIKFFYYSCLHYFHSEEKLQAHETECKKVNDCAIILPREDQKWLEFDSNNNKERVPFVIYADLECVLKKMEKNKTEKTSSFAYQHHIAYYVKCSFDDALSMYRFRRDKDCVAWFAKELENLAYDMKARISANYVQWQAKYPDVFLIEKILRKKGNKVYVKWLGFDGSHNSWINKRDVI